MVRDMAAYKDFGNNNATGDATYDVFSSGRMRPEIFRHSLLEPCGVGEGLFPSLGPGGVHSALDQHFTTGSFFRFFCLTS